MFKKINFYLIFFVTMTMYWFLTTIIAASGMDISIIKIVLLIIGGLSFFIHWVITKFTIKEYILQILFLGFLIFVYVKSGFENEGVLLIFPLIIGLKNVNIKKATKTMFFTLLILEILTILFTCIGIIPYEVDTKTDAFGNTYKMIRIANAHGNSNYVPIFTMIALYLYTYYSKINLKKALILQIIAIVFYIFFGCRTGLILSCLTIWSIYLSKKIKLRENSIIIKITKKLVPYSQLFLFVFVYFVAMYMTDTAFYDFLNKLVSSRILEAYTYINRYKLSPWPRNVTYYICDNSQTYIMLSFGLIYTLINVIVYYLAIRNLLKKGKNIEVFFIIIYILYSYAEINFIKPIPNFSMLFLIYAFYPNRKVDDLNAETKGNT